MSEIYNPFFFTKEYMSSLSLLMVLIRMCTWHPFDGDVSKNVRTVLTETVVQSPNTQLHRFFCGPLIILKNTLGHFSVEFDATNATKSPGMGICSMLPSFKTF